MPFYSSLPIAVDHAALALTLNLNPGVNRSPLFTVVWSW